MTDLWTMLATIIGSGGVAWLAAQWAAQRFVDHRLALRLEDHKGQLSEALARTKAALDAEVAEAQSRLQAALHRSNELMLGEEAAERAYRFEARKRLYTAVGPLRFQLMDACVQLRYRVASFTRTGFKVSLEGYFGQSLLFRIGRLLAVTELIERQIAHADFSVDPATIILFRFRLLVLRALSGNEVALDHPKADWNRQVEHIFRDQLPILAISMVVAEENRPERVVRFDEFRHLVEQNTGYLDPLASMVDGFDPTEMPIFWLRLLAMAEACAGLLDHEPIAPALDPPELDLAELLAVSKDAHLAENAPRYLAVLADFRRRVAVPAGGGDSAAAGASGQSA